MSLTKGLTGNPKDRKGKIHHNRNRNRNRMKKHTIKKKQYDYFVKSKIILDNLENEMSFKMKKLPKYLSDYNKSMCTLPKLKNKSV